MARSSMQTRLYSLTCSDKNPLALLLSRSLDSHTAPRQRWSAKALCFTQEERDPVNIDPGQMGSLLQYTVEWGSMKSWLQSQMLKGKSKCWQAGHMLLNVSKNKHRRCRLGEFAYFSFFETTRLLVFLWTGCGLFKYNPHQFSFFLTN